MALSSYDTTDPGGETKRAALAAVAWLSDCLTPGSCPRWLTLLGRSGVGKTMLAELCDTALRRHQPQRPKRMRRWSTVIDHLHRGEWGIIEELASQPVLILDELLHDYTTGSLSPWDVKTLKSLSGLLDRRLGRWTILTDNRLFAEVGALETRIASRMVRGGSKVIEFRTTPDYCLAQLRKS